MLDRALNRGVWTAIVLAVAVAVAVTVTVAACSYTPFFATCLVGDQLDPETAAELDTVARELIAHLSAGDVEALLARVHPAASDGFRTTETTEFLRAAQSALSVATIDGPRELVLVDIHGPPPATAVCAGEGGGIGDPDGLTVQLLRRPGREALVAYRFESNRMTSSLAMHLKEQGGRWTLVAVHIDVAAFDGRSTEYYEARAAEAFRDGDTVSAALLYGVAWEMASWIPNAHSRTEGRLAKRLAELRDSPAVAEMSDGWRLAGRGIRVYGMRAQFFAEDAILTVRFVTDAGLDEASTRPEAELIAEYITRTFPAAAREFDSIAASAFSEPPTDPNRSYLNYTHVIPIDRPRESAAGVVR